MSRALNDLTSRTRPIMVELLAQIAEAGIPCLIVDTLRTEAEHAANLAKGTSGSILSRHLPLKLRLKGAMLPIGCVPRDRDKSDAIDLAPFEQYQLHGPDKLQWNVADPAWLRIGLIGEGLGLRWGGRWLSPRDPGHFEFLDADDPVRVALVTEERSRPYPVKT